MDSQLDLPQIFVPFCTIPNDIIFSILDACAPRDRATFALSSKAIYNFLGGPAYLSRQRIQKITDFLQRQAASTEVIDTLRYRRICGACTTIKPYWQFSKEGGIKTRARKRLKDRKNGKEKNGNEALPPGTRKCWQCIQKEGKSRGQSMIWFGHGSTLLFPEEVVVVCKKKGCGKMKLKDHFSSETDKFAMEGGNHGSVCKKFESRDLDLVLQDLTILEGTLHRPESMVVYKGREMRKQILSKLEVEISALTGLEDDEKQKFRLDRQKDYECDLKHLWYMAFTHCTEVHDKPTCCHRLGYFPNPLREHLIDLDKEVFSLPGSISRFGVEEFF